MRCKKLKVSRPRLLHSVCFSLQLGLPTCYNLAITITSLRPAALSSSSASSYLISSFSSSSPPSSCRPSFCSSCARVASRAQISTPKTPCSVSTAVVSSSSSNCQRQRQPSRVQITPDPLNSFLLLLVVVISYEASSWTTNVHRRRFLDRRCSTLLLSLPASIFQNNSNSNSNNNSRARMDARIPHTMRYTIQRRNRREQPPPSAMAPLRSRQI
jgi:hypothetical protein